MPKFTTAARRRFKDLKLNINDAEIYNCRPGAAGGENRSLSSCFPGTDVSRFTGVAGCAI